jgi:hypothetical protein
MILSAHQPAYLPWLGYFDKIARADVFVYMDSVQFEKNSFINRNQIKTPQGKMWLTIPVKAKGHISGSIGTTEIDETQQWRLKHLKSIEMNYRKAACFKERYPEIEKLIINSESNLSEYCFQQLKFWLSKLSINTEIVKLSELDIRSSKSDLILEMCRKLNATRYISGINGKSYLNEKEFLDNGICVEYQNFKTHPYKQLYNEFIPDLSVLDWWINEC